ncbi:MAG: response regulator transcription factor [Ignavibacteriales bacterium]|nr:response regulator transcription factor [Ignavibacteriales bacterium]
MKTRIILADDHVILREGLKKIIEHEMRMNVVGQASDGRTVIELVREHHPDIVIMDISMNGLNGIEATRYIKKEFPNVKVIALSMHTERNIVSEMLCAGASAYLLKDSAPDELALAIHAIQNNKTYISPDIAGIVVDDYILKTNTVNQLQSNFKKKPATILTAREREILQLLAEGKSIKDIAGLLSISTTTIETHKQHIMEKLKLYSIAELTKYAIREGITQL